MPEDRMFDIWEKLTHDFVEEGYYPLTHVEMVVTLEIVVYDEGVAIAKAGTGKRWAQEVVSVMADDSDYDDYDDPELLSYEEMERRDNALLDCTGELPFGPSGWGNPY